MYCPSTCACCVVLVSLSCKGAGEVLGGGGEGVNVSCKLNSLTDPQLSSHIHQMKAIAANEPGTPPGDGGGVGWGGGSDLSGNAPLIPLSALTQ